MCCQCQPPVNVPSLCMCWTVAVQTNVHQHPWLTCPSEWPRDVLNPLANTPWPSAGLAAGFDKDAAAPEGLLGMGFGFMEVGERPLLMHRAALPDPGCLAICSTWQCHPLGLTWFQTGGKSFCRLHNALASARQPQAQELPFARARVGVVSASAGQQQCLAPAIPCWLSTVLSKSEQHQYLAPPMQGQFSLLPVASMLTSSGHLLPQHRCRGLINRYGFNSQGVDAVQQHLRRFRERQRAELQRIEQQRQEAQGGRLEGQ